MDNIFAFLEGQKGLRSLLTIVAMYYFQLGIGHRELEKQDLTLNPLSPMLVLGCLQYKHHFICDRAHCNPVVEGGDGIFVYGVL